MYEIKLIGAEGGEVLLKVETKQRARGIAKVAKESKIGCEVTYNPEPRKVEFENL